MDYHLNYIINVKNLQKFKGNKVFLKYLLMILLIRFYFLDLIFNILHKNIIKYNYHNQQ